MTITDKQAKFESAMMALDTADGTLYPGDFERNADGTYFRKPMRDRWAAWSAALEAAEAERMCATHHDITADIVRSCAASGIEVDSLDVLMAVERALPVAAPSSAEQAADELHPKTRDLVTRFSAAMAEKLLKAQRKYGYSDGWADAGWLDECRQHLRQHVAKGDPLDVANYCAFLWHHGASTTAPGAPEADGRDIVSLTAELASCQCALQRRTDERNKFAAELDACSPYLKPGERVVDRIARELRDSASLLEMLAAERTALEAARAQSSAALDAPRSGQDPARKSCTNTERRA